jgi:hypothetical protein
MTLVLVVKNVVNYSVVHATVPYQIVIYIPTGVLARTQYRDGTLIHPTVTARHLTTEAVREMETVLCLKTNAERSVTPEGHVLKYVNYPVNPNVKSSIRTGITTRKRILQARRVRWLRRRPEQIFNRTGLQANMQCHCSQKTRSVSTAHQAHQGINKLHFGL